jgi:hypothetical protein
LADKECRLVEVNVSALSDLRVTFPTTETIRRPSPEGGSPARVDESQWIVAVVAFLMISWGLILLAAGLFSGSRGDAVVSPLGNGSPQLLGVGGAATAMLGLVLLVLAWRRDWLPSTFLLALLSWLSLLAGLGFLLSLFFDFEPGRNIQVALATGIALIISLLTRLLERSAKRKLKPAPPPKPWNYASSAAKSRTGETRRGR